MICHSLDLGNINTRRFRILIAREEHPPTYTSAAKVTETLARGPEVSAENRMRQPRQRLKTSLKAHT